MISMMKKLMAYNLFWSCKPDVDANTMIFTFRKTNHKGQVIHKTYRMTLIEMERLSVDIEDVLIDFAERFMEDFNAEEDKYWD